MSISDSDIADAVSAYLLRYPDEAEQLAEPLRLLNEGENFAWRRTFPMHVTAGALLCRGEEILLVEHRAYGMILQPGGHLEPETDQSLVDAAVRELSEETGVDPAHLALVSKTPCYVEFGRVPPRPLSGVVKASGQVVAWLPVEAREFRDESWPTCKVAMHGDQ